MRRLVISLRPVLVAIVLVVTANWILCATVKPTIASMASRSDAIVLGKIVDVRKPGDSLRTVTIEVSELIRGNPFARSGNKKLSFSYEGIGKGNISFLKIKKDGTQRVFFLKYVPDPGIDEKVTSFHLELTDAWFGVESNDTTIINKVAMIERKIANAYKGIRR